MPGLKKIKCDNLPSTHIVYLVTMKCGHLMIFHTHPSAVQSFACHSPSPHHRLTILHGVGQMKSPPFGGYPSAVSSWPAALLACVCAVVLSLTHPARLIY